MTLFDSQMTLFDSPKNVNQCNFCNKLFSKNSNLHHHIKNVKRIKKNLKWLYWHLNFTSKYLNFTSKYLNFTSKYLSFTTKYHKNISMLILWYKILIFFCIQKKTLNKKLRVFFHHVDFFIYFFIFWIFKK